MISYGIVGDNIKGIVLQLNAMFSWMLEMLQNPAALMQMINSVNPTIREAVTATAITLCTLFFLIDFFVKTLHLQWVTWENVLMLFMKVIVAKFFVDNAEWLMTMISNGFNSMISAIPDFSQFIPHGEAAYPYFLAGEDLALVQSGAEAGFLDFSPLLLDLKVTIQGFIMQIVMMMASIIVVARMFELVVYTVAAPVPLSTLACDGLQDVGKGFLKSYAAVCVQAVVLLIMFFAFQSLVFTNSHMPIMRDWQGMINTFVLGAAVMQSGAWAKKICGAM